MEATTSMVDTRPLRSGITAIDVPSQIEATLVKFKGQRTMLSYGLLKYLFSSHPSVLVPKLDHQKRGARCVARWNAVDDRKPERTMIMGGRVG